MFTYQCGEFLKHACAEWQEMEDPRLGLMEFGSQLPARYLSILSGRRVYFSDVARACEPCMRAVVIL